MQRIYRRYNAVNMKVEKQMYLLLCNRELIDIIDGIDNIYFLRVYLFIFLFIRIKLDYYIIYL